MVVSEGRLCDPCARVSRVSHVCPVCVPAPPGVFLAVSFYYSSTPRCLFTTPGVKVLKTPGKTPGGAGTHTGHTGTVPGYSTRVQ